MTLEEFCSKGWQEHATDAAGVMARLPQGVALVTGAKHIPMLAGLVVHVAGEHLGRWNEGLALLGSLERLPFFDPATPDGKSLRRSQAVLHRCAENRTEEERCFAEGRTGGGVPEASDRIRVLAISSAAFVGQKRMAEARADFEEAVALAAYGPSKTDPAARALAVTANNIAVELENRSSLAPDERSLMLHAAQVSRHFWAIAGGWLEAERAEYRLAMSHIKAGEAATALRHAHHCQRIVTENGNDAGESFFAHEAIARAQLCAGDAAAARIEREVMAGLLPTVADAGFRSFCVEELAKLDAALASH